jgi:DNA-binding NtrC family response regulator
MSKRARVLIIDDDLTFGAILEAMLRKNGLDAEFHPSLVELGSFARLREFDLAVVDYFLDSLRGDEVAQYADTFFAGLPILVVSAKAFSPEETARWPQSVREFIAKDRGPQAVVDAARRILDEGAATAPLGGSLDGPAAHSGPR